MFSLCRVSYCGMWTNFPVSPEDQHCSSLQAGIFRPLWLHEQGHFSHVGWEKEYLPPRLWMLTELSLHCMGAECGQIFGTGTWLGFQHLSCWSPAESCSQNRSPNSFLYNTQISQMSVSWALVISGCVQLGGIKRYVWVHLFQIPCFSFTQTLVLCCFNRTAEQRSRIK